jgi:hypothetical protein
MVAFKTVEGKYRAAPIRLQFSRLEGAKKWLRLLPIRASLAISRELASVDAIGSSLCPDRYYAANRGSTTRTSRKLRSNMKTVDKE